MTRGPVTEREGEIHLVDPEAHPVTAAFSIGKIRERYRMGRPAKRARQTRPDIRYVRAVEPNRLPTPERVIPTGLLVAGLVPRGARIRQSRARSAEDADAFRL